MTERFAYFVFLAVVGGALTIMTVGLAVIWFFLVRRNRQARQDERPRHPAAGRAPGPGVEG